MQSPLSHTVTTTKLDVTAFEPNVSIGSFPVSYSASIRIGPTKPGGPAEPD